MNKKKTLVPTVNYKFGSVAERDLFIVEAKASALPESSRVLIGTFSIMAGRGIYHVKGFMV